MKWFLKVLKDYANFDGRARRKEFCMFILFGIIFAAMALVFDILADITFDKKYYGPFYILYWLAILLPTVAVTVRRLHDINKSGWMFVIVLIPIIGQIWIVILMITDSYIGENEYGKNPKGVKRNK